MEDMQDEWINHLHLEKFSCILLMREAAIMQSKKGNYSHNLLIIKRLNRNANAGEMQVNEVFIL